MKVVVLYDENTYVLMWQRQGHEVIPIEDILDADVVQFTGGADVSPELYDEVPHPSTSTSPMRDDYEIQVFNTCLENQIPMVGICRGGQFLNVMNGGGLWQNVDKHAIGGTHMAVDVSTGRMIPVTSTHHQMMRPSEEGQVLMVASESTHLEKMQNGGIVTVPARRGEDIEAVWYPETECFCFQPHPEYMQSDSPCQQWYFQQINELIGE